MPLNATQIITATGQAKLAEAMFEALEVRITDVALGDGNGARYAPSEAQTALRDAITALETSAREALAAIETEQAERIAGIAREVGQQSAEAIDHALREQTAHALTELDAASERSAAAGREITRQLRDQLAKVNVK